MSRSNPALFVLSQPIPRGDDWLHEPKLDGYRLQIVKEDRAVRLHSKSGSDWTKRLASLVKALRGLYCKSAVIDGELVFPAADGSSARGPMASGIRLHASTSLLRIA